MLKSAFYIVLISFFIVPKAGSAQKYSWGPTMRIPDNAKRHDYMVGQIDSTIYLYRFSYGFQLREIHTIDAINPKTGAFLFSKEIELLHNDTLKSLRVLYFFVYGNKLFAFSQQDNKREKSFDLYLSEINAKNGNIISNKKMDSNPKDSEEVKGEYNAKFYNEKGQFITYFTRTSLYSKKQKAIVSFWDPEMSLIERKEFQLGSETKSSKLVSINQNGADDILMVVDSRKPDFVELSNGATPTTHKLIYYSNVTKTVLEYTIETADPGYIASNIRVVATNKGFAIAGFMGNKKFANIQGCFTMYFDREEGKFSEPVLEYFTSDHLKELLTKNKGWQTTEYGNDYVIDDIIISDGHIKIIAEQRGNGDDWNGFYNNYYMGNRYYSSPYYYNRWPRGCDIILAIDLNENQKINWLRILPKDQNCDIEYSMSYASLYKGGNLYFIYNDHPVNLRGTDEYGPKRYVNMYGGVTVLATLSSTGELKTERLFKEGVQKIVLRPNLCYQNSNNSLFMYAAGKNKFRLGTLSFD